MQLAGVMKRQLAFTLIELMVTVAIVGVLSAIAIPSFLKFQFRSKQAEVKANLKTLFVAEQSYFPEFDSYTDSVAKLGFSPERGNRYSYALNNPGNYAPRSTSTITLTDQMNAIEVDTFKFPLVAAQPPATLSAQLATGNNGNFLAVAVGNIDPNSLLDEWSVASTTRPGATSSSSTSCAAGANPAGEPCQDQGPL